MFANEHCKRSVASMKRAARLSLTLLIFTKSACWADASGLNPMALEAFRYFQDSVSSISTVLADIESAPDRAWISKDKESFERKPDSYLDGAIALFLPEEHAEIRDELVSLDSTLATLKEKISTLEAERPFRGEGPERNSGIEGTLRSLMSEGISGVVFGQDIETGIQEPESRRTILISDFRRYMNREHSMYLTVRQCESLLYQVNGRDLVDAIAAAKVLTETEEHLRNVISGAGPDFSRKAHLDYYGLALIVRLTVERLRERHLQNCDEKYLPALAELSDGNDRLRTDNLTLLAELDSREQARIRIIEHNVRVADAARRAIDLYRNMLERKREETVRMLEDASGNVKAARATLETLEHVVEAGDVVSGALEGFNALSALEAPDLLPLDDEALYESLLDISRSLSDRLES